jgi:predicted RecA/RadA family phage recombinase
MQARFIHDGKAIDFLTDTDIAAGTVVVQGSLVGVTKVDIPAGSLGTIHLVGVYDVEKSNVAIPIGSKVYWDNTAKKATLNATGNTQLGIAIIAATAEDSIVRIKLT